MGFYKFFLFCSVITTLLFSYINHGVARENVRVVASIAPLHSLVSGLMKKESEAHLLVKNGSSPHSYALRPSDARAIQEADLIFWVGEDLEVFLTKPLRNQHNKGQVISLSKVANITLLPIRDSDGHHHEHEHEDSSNDMHVWLNPLNAKAMVGAMAEALIKVDPENSIFYLQQKKHMLKRLDSLDKDLKRNLSPVKDIPYMVFHDGFQYFEKQYNLTSVSAVTPSPEHRPGARRIREVRNALQKYEVQCIFQEPQFSSSIIRSIIGNNKIKTANIDPLGSSFKPGKEHYFNTMMAIGDSMVGCLSETK
ncbi:MAG: zinc ABC transporter substrate-binding protein [Magnetococcales bacterium]|nr:zinc ABC transporter substrate-binding protein [Magnetococcales bacterium]